MRVAWLVSGLLLLGLVWTPQVCWPTDPSTVSAAQAGLLLGALGIRQMEDGVVSQARVYAPSLSWSADS